MTDEAITVPIKDGNTQEPVGVVQLAWMEGRISHSLVVQGLTEEQAVKVAQFVRTLFCPVH